MSSNYDDIIKDVIVEPWGPFCFVSRPVASASDRFFFSAERSQSEPASLKLLESAFKCVVVCDFFLFFCCWWLIVPRSITVTLAVFLLLLLLSESPASSMFYVSWEGPIKSELDSLAEN